MKTIKLIAIFVLAALILNGCKKDKKDETPTPTGPATTATVHITGVVYDNNGYPLSDVEVTCGNKTDVTDYKGVYSFLGFVAPIEKYVVTFKKSGYFTGVRTFKPKAGAYQHSEVMLISYYAGNAGSTTFNSTDATTMYVGSTGCEIDFPANNWIDENTGSTYSGTVSVYAAYMDPSNSLYGQYAYGGLMMGKTSASEKVYLEPYAGLVVEIYGESGQKLNLDTTAKANATIRLQIPSSMTNAPANVDLWDFDMDEGIAGAGGSASKQGDKYVSEVQHFSMWSCEKICSGNPATISGRVTDGTNPVSGVPILIGSTCIMTDVDGKFTANVPAGIQVPVGVKPNYLGTTVTPLLVGPLSSDEAYIIPSDFVVPGVTYITGKLVNCNGQGVKGQVTFNNYNYTTSAYTDLSGNFSIPINTSMMYGNIIAHGNNTTTEQYVSISTFPYDAGNITLCPPIPTGPNEITINGTTYNDWTSKSGYVYSMNNSVSIYMSNGSNYVSIMFSPTSPGSYQVNEMNNCTVNGTIDGISINAISGTINVTQMGAVGQLINGTFTNCSDGTNNFSGKFSVQREPDVR